MPLLAVEDLAIHFSTPEGVVRAVDGVSFEIARGEVLALVGESGSGKTVTGLSLLRLLPGPLASIEAGSALLRCGEDEPPVDLITAPEQRLRELRGNRLAMVFQNPMASLNPYLKIGPQLTEVLEVHQQLHGAAARERARDLLGQAGIPSPEQRLEDYPHQLSGGMCQRVMIAMALLCRPDLLIADEPTSALDVTVQAQILELLRSPAEAATSSILLITHDMGVVASAADRVAVMYAGRIVEQGPVAKVFGRPHHPYTQALMRAVPRIDEAHPGPLQGIDGTPPTTAARPPGCPFHPRCEARIAPCADALPAERTLDGGGQHRVCCHREVSS